MSYPSAPWHLKGCAYVSLHLVDYNKARSHVPSYLDLVSVLPGYTVGGVYVSRYGAGSVLQYSELIVVPGLVKHRNTIGAWISHIYVDNPDSVAGGREIWGLPKEIAQFDWHDRPSVVVKQSDRILCAMQVGWQLPLWHQSFAGQVFSQLQTLVQFQGKASFRSSIIGADLTIPATSPFASLALDRPWLAVGCDNLDLWVGAPINAT